MPPDVLGAWGQLAGAFFTLAAVVVALGIAVYDARRRRKELEDQRAAQARTVTATVALVPVESPYGDASSKHYMAVVIENHGILPITRVILRGVITTVDDVKLSDWRVANASQADRSEFQAISLTTVLKAGGSFISGPLMFHDNDRVVERFDPWMTHVSIGFVDAEGMSWLRDGNGRPRRWLNAFDELRIHQQPDPEL